MSIMSLARDRWGVWGVSWPQQRMCKVAGLQIERFYSVGRQRIEGSCPLVWGHCLQDKLLGFRRVRFRNNIGNMHRLAAKSKHGHPNNLSRDWLQFRHARQYARWPSPKLVPYEAPSSQEPTTVTTTYLT